MEIVILVKSISIRALYDVVEQIKLDIANFYLDQAKTTIKQHSIEYERKKFEEFLQKHPDGEIIFRALKLRISRPQNMHICSRKLFTYFDLTPPTTHYLQWTIPHLY